MSETLKIISFRHTPQHTQYLTDAAVAGMKKLAIRKRITPLSARRACATRCRAFTASAGF
jgi:hypothetical protein